MGRTEEEIQVASQHVKYELDMLAATTSFLSKGPGGTDQVTWNAYLESFLLHLRNLIDFYYLSGEPKDYILAEHYVGNVTQWGVDRPKMTPLLKDAQKRVNNFANHLTYKRLVWDKKWSFADISAHLEKLRSCFIRHLPPNRKDWFQFAETQGPEGPTGTTNAAIVTGWTGPAGPTGFGETTTQK